MWIFSIYYTLVPLPPVETLQGLIIKYAILQAFLFGMVDTQRLGSWKKNINSLTFWSTHCILSYFYILLRSCTTEIFQTSEGLSGNQCDFLNLIVSIINPLDPDQIL